MSEALFDRGIISTYASGVDLVFEWKIENFFNLPKRSLDFQCSPKFSFGGVRWSLWIHPYGSSEYDTSGYVNLSLFKHDPNCSIKQSFSLSLKTVTGEKYNEQLYTKDFNDWIENGHDFHRFMRISELIMRRSELVPDSVLTVVCTMKNSTSAGTASNTASAKCCHCKGTFNADSLSSHQKKCVHRPVKCPDCLEIVVLQKWFYEHECQQERPEGNTALCCHCKITFNADSLSSHQKKCMHRPVECSDCLEIVEFQTWLKEHEFQHKCQQERLECNTASTSPECCHCKGTFNADSLSSHQKKCIHRSIKCPNCLEVVVLQNWLDDHEYQQERPEGRSKLDLSCSPDDLTVYLEDGTEIDEDDIYYMLPDGTVFFLCQEGENPSQLNMTSPTNFETNTSSLLDGSESTLPTQSVCDLNEGAASKKPWPKNFTINFDKCSEELKKQMNKGISYLKGQTKHELLNIIAEEISRYTLHPDIKQRKQVAAHLIEVYPSLKSGIDDGLCGWAERIYAKMKDHRLKIGTAESKAVRKNKKKISLEYIKVPHRCESNFLPTSVISPEEELSMISWMKEEAKIPLKDQDKEMINQYLFATFPTRCNYLAKNIMPFKDLKENYPLLFTSDNLIKEFKNLQDIDIGVWIKNFKNCADKIISEANKKQKSKNSDDVLTPLRQKRASALVLKSKIFSYYEAVDTSEIRHTLLCAFLLLPIVLYDEAKNLYRIIMPDCPIENVATDTSTPVIIFIGNPFDSTELYICGENIILVNDINDAVTAITVLFCLYYVCNIEYPPNCLSTFLFFQNYLLELHYGKKLPPKLINLIEKF